MDYLRKTCSTRIGFIGIGNMGSETAGLERVRPLLELMGKKMVERDTSSLLVLEQMAGRT